MYYKIGDISFVQIWVSLIKLNWENYSLYFRLTPVLSPPRISYNILQQKSHWSCVTTSAQGRLTNYNKPTYKYSSAHPTSRQSLHQGQWWISNLNQNCCDEWTCLLSRQHFVTHLCFQATWSVKRFRAYFSLY